MTPVRWSMSWTPTPRIRAAAASPWHADVRLRLIPMLREHPTALVLLAFDMARPWVLPLASGDVELSCAPLLNIHDLAVRPGYRGRAWAGPCSLRRKRARDRDCCKLTLEVQDDNTPARTLYERFGFRDVVYGDSGPTRFLSKKLDQEITMKASRRPAAGMLAMLLAAPLAAPTR